MGHPLLKPSFEIYSFSTECVINVIEENVLLMLLDEIFLMES